MFSIWAHKINVGDVVDANQVIIAVSIIDATSRFRNFFKS
jgi:hypothetical protein